MNREEHLWEVAQEEALEIAKVISKIQRFGLHNTQPSSGRTNKELLMEEINDLYAALEMLVEDFVMNFSDILPKKDLIADKKKKVEEHLEISRKAGRLE